MLSHPFGKDTPVYRYSPPIVIYGHRLIERGDKFNNYRLELWNHHGTHIDGPNHIDRAWRRLCDFPIDFFVFERPFLVDLKATDNELITADTLEAALEPARDPDLLLIRTGWTEIRKQDPDRFVNRNPGLSSAAARLLLQRLPNVRAIGVDNFSIGAMVHFAEEVETHRILLDPASGDRVIIEDMNLPHDLPALRKVWTIPLYVEDIDSSWCTAFAEV
jgi:kynurenine formamidase